MSSDSILRTPAIKRSADLTRSSKTENAMARLPKASEHLVQHTSTTVERHTERLTLEHATPTLSEMSPVQRVDSVKNISSWRKYWRTKNPQIDQIFKKYLLKPIKIIPISWIRPKFWFCIRCQDGTNGLQFFHAGCRTRPIFWHASVHHRNSSAQFGSKSWRKKKQLKTTSEFSILHQIFSKIDSEKI